MRVTSFLFALALVVMGLNLPAGEGHAQDARVVPEGANWRAVMNQGVNTDNHWRWTLRSVERTGDKLTVALRYRNNATTPRPILLEDQFMTRIVLVDEVANTRFPLLSVDGVSENITAVDRKKSKSAVFTFAYPEGATSVLFTSKWISMRMGGEASIMEVEFPIDIPPAKAQPT